jgi:septum formation topological specificity factor MinE
VVYWLLILAIVIIWGLLTLIKIYRREIFEFFARYRKNNSAYALARKQIIIAHKKHDAGAFYSIFMVLLEKYTGVRAAQLSPEMVDQQLAQAGLSAPAIEDWRLFFAQLCQARFYQQSHDVVFYNQLKEKSLYWIDILEKLAGGK